MVEYSDRYEDEVELIDIISVIWRWRLFLASGLVVFCIFASIVCIYIDKVYRVTMAIQPGLISMDDTGKRTYMDPIETVAGRIGAGIYNDEIVSRVFRPGFNLDPDSLKFKVEIPKQSDVILVHFEHSDAGLGLAVLEDLFSRIKNHEKHLIDQMKDGFERRISLARIELQKQKDLEGSYNANIRNLDIRMQEARSDIGEISRNNINLVREKKKMFEQKSEDGKALSLLIYSNTIQQNIQYVNSLKKELSEHDLLKEEELQKTIEVKKEQEKINEEILILEKQKESIRPMAMLRKPSVSKEPVKPKKVLIFVLTLISGFFITLVLIFFIEYVRNSLDISAKNLVVKEMGV